MKKMSGLTLAKKKTRRFNWLNKCIEQPIEIVTTKDKNQNRKKRDLKRKKNNTDNNDVWACYYYYSFHWYSALFGKYIWVFVCCSSCFELFLGSLFRFHTFHNQFFVLVLCWARTGPDCFRLLMSNMRCFLFGIYPPSSGLRMQRKRERERARTGTRAR